MEKYSWSEQELENKIKKLEQFEKKDTKIAQDIMTLHQMLDKNNEEDTSWITDVIVEMKDLQPQLQKWISDFYTITVNECHNFPSLRNLDISNDDCLEVVHDFYKTRNQTFYQEFLKLWKEKTTNLNITNGFLQTHAITYHLITENKSYIKIERTNTIMDLINLTHEYGHAITHLYNPNIITNKNFILARELDGLYFQSRFIEYLIMNNQYPEEATLAKLLINYNMFRKTRYLLTDFDLSRAIYLISYLATIELLQEEDEQADNILKQILGKNPQSITDCLDILTHYFIMNESVTHFQKKMTHQAKRYFSQQ